MIRTAGYGLPPLLDPPPPQQRQFVCRQLGEFNFNLEWGSRWAQFTRLKISDSRKPKHRQQTRNAR